MNSPKKILLINQYFYPDMAATSQLLGDLAQWLGSKGWDVVAVAGRGSYAAPGGSSDKRSGRLWPGVSVRRVWCTNFGRGNPVGRLCDYLTFLLSAAAALAFVLEADIVVCLSTPPFVAMLGLIARLKGSRLVYKVEDVYPEVAVALGALNKHSLLTRSFQRLSRFLLAKADQVVTLDETMAALLKCTGASYVETIPNWADGIAIHPDAQVGQTFRTMHGLEGRFVVLYSGNLGRAHQFDAVLDAAKRCTETLPDVLFLFVGNGARLKEVHEAAIGLDNVRFMQYQPREQLNQLYNAADVHLVTLRDEASGLLFPSKYPAALAAGKPVLLVGGRDAPFEREIEDRQLGWTCPHEASAVMEAIEDGLSNPGKLKAMGIRARQVFETTYSKTIAMRRWEQLLNCVLDGEQIMKTVERPQEAAVPDEVQAVAGRSI